MLSANIEEYAFTIGMIVSFAGMIIAAVAGRKVIASLLKHIGLRKEHLVIAAGIIVLFLLIELFIVKPTQQLFFDDAIYQAMAVDLLHTGQAWMCDYGTPVACFTGEIFHEPTGASFNLALGYALFGISRATTYGVGLGVAAAAIGMIFLVTFVLFRDPVVALFSELLLALSPIVIMFAMPTTSDMPYLTVR